MTLALVAPGVAMGLGAGQHGLIQPMRASSSPADPSGFAGPWPNAIPNLSGWWDGGLINDILDTNGNPVAAWNGTVGSLADKSGQGLPMLPYHAAASGFQPPVATPRLCGLLGGVGLAVGGAGTLAPALDPDLGWQIANVPAGPTVGWTRYLVWTRPNWRQGTLAQNANPITLLRVGGVDVLQADAAAGTRLILFPGPGQTVLTSALERRHTHSIVLRNTPGEGIDVWLDAAQVATGITNPIPTGIIAPMLLLHDTTTQGSAQCWFHESATWERPLTDPEVTILLSAATRWVRGKRRGVNLVVIGQSNAGYSFTDGAWNLMAQGVAWYLGAAAYNVIALWGSGTAYTCISGHGIYVEGVFPGSFVNDPGDGSNPSTWALGADGQAVAAYLALQATDDLADIDVLLWPWNETDSLRPYSEKAQFKAAAERFLALARGVLGRSVASLPLIWWNAIPYGNPDGIQMHRESVFEIAGDPTQNVVIGMPMTADSNPRGASWNPATGQFSGGDSGHRDVTDNLRFGQLAAPVVARAVLAAGGADTLAAIPAGLAVVGGPRIVHAYRQSNTVIVVTVQHDAGTDLIVALQALAGAGWAVMDGGSVATPGPVVPAVACARIDPTHLLVTLARPLVSPSAQCLLFYPYGPTDIGRGNSVTDNASLLTPPPGWDIAGDLGTSWGLDFPLAATAEPLPLSDTP